MRALPSSDQALAIPHVRIHSDDDHLLGDGPNPHWNIHRSLEMLQGLQSAAMLLIQEWTNTSNSAMPAAASTHT